MYNATEKDKKEDENIREVSDNNLVLEGTETGRCLLDKKACCQEIVMKSADEKLLRLWCMVTLGGNIISKSPLQCRRRDVSQMLTLGSWYIPAGVGLDFNDRLIVVCKFTVLFMKHVSIEKLTDRTNVKI